MIKLKQLQLAIQGSTGLGEILDKYKELDNKNALISKNPPSPACGYKKTVHALNKLNNNEAS